MKIAGKPARRRVSIMLGAGAVAGAIGAVIVPAAVSHPAPQPSSSRLGGPLGFSGSSSDHSGRPAKHRNSKHTVSHRRGWIPASGGWRMSW